MNRALQIVLSLSLVAVVFGVLIWLFNHQEPTLEWTNVLLPDGSYVAVEVMSTTAQKAQGLSGRSGLQAGNGMLFPYEKPQQIGMWMKGMSFPIDIVWINADTVANIVEGAPVPVPGQPIPSYRPVVEATDVLELPDGYAVAHGLHVGAAVHIERHPPTSGSGF